MTNFQIQTELYQAGTDECGTPYTAELYTIVAETESGKRFCAPVYFPGCSVGVNPDGWQCFGDIRKQAMEEARDWLDCFEVWGGNFNDWQWTDPAYGSEAWISMNGTGYFAARERAEDNNVPF